MDAPYAPDTWHPWYEGRTDYILKWLNEGEPDYQTLVIPVSYPSVHDERVYAVSGEPFRLTMDRGTAYGPAPYVGSPFIYVWEVGIDSLGRQVAGSAKIEYIRERR